MVRSCHVIKTVFHQQPDREAFECYVMYNDSELAFKNTSISVYWF